MSYNKPVIFALAHTDPLGAIQIYNTVLEYIQAGGTAILVDWSSEFNNPDIIYVEIAKMNEDGKGHSPMYWEKPE